MRNESSISVEVEYLDGPSVVGALERAVAALASSRPELRRVILFGSLATSQYTPDSDADLLFVVDESAEPSPFRAAPYLLALTPAVPIPLDILVWTEREVTIARQHRDPFLLEAERTGRTLLCRGVASGE